MSTLNHRDCLEISDCTVVETETAWKPINRPHTIALGNHQVYVGMAFLAPKTRDRRDASQHVVVAIPYDLHHIVLTHEQATELGNLLLLYAHAGGATPLAPREDYP